MSGRTGRRRAPSHAVVPSSAAKTTSAERGIAGTGDDALEPMPAIDPSARYVVMNFPGPMRLETRLSPPKVYAPQLAVFGPPND